MALQVALQRHYECSWWAAGLARASLALAGLRTRRMPVLAMRTALVLAPAVPVQELALAPAGVAQRRRLWPGLAIGPQ